MVGEEGARVVEQVQTAVRPIFFLASRTNYLKEIQISEEVDTGEKEKDL